MVAKFLLFDFENVQPTSLGALKPGQCGIKIFLGQNQSKLPLDLSRALQPFGQDVEFIQISGNGPNAVDFHIAFYIGKLVGLYPNASYTIVSRDTGFDPLIRHLKASGVSCTRVAAIGSSTSTAAVPKAAAGPNPASVNKTAAVKTKLAKNVAVAILAEANSSPAKRKSVATTSSTRVGEAVKRLKGLKAARPAKLKTLQSSIQSWFKPALTAKELASIIQSLTDTGKIKVDGTKVTYSLG